MLWSKLWFAFILVSLNHWKQQNEPIIFWYTVVICFHFSIFEPLETARKQVKWWVRLLWFAFILVSLNHWKQPYLNTENSNSVVICFHFSIFEPLETAENMKAEQFAPLWFAFILVSLNHWKQPRGFKSTASPGCDLLSF